MFRSFRNFPRLNDKGNVVTAPQVNVFVADGINDTSKGVWISPTRSVTNEDGTLHIGLMNPFEGASVSNASGGVDCSGQPTIPQCQTICTQCDCQAVFAQVCAKWEQTQGSPCPYNTAECVFAGADPNCVVGCRLTNSGNAFIFFLTDCNGNQVSFGQGTPYDCASVVPPDVQSTIVRAVERFMLEMDLSGLSSVPSSRINSAILRLPIKRNLDWM
jgi:hypothetical protein